jgi:hypothetical protein
MSLRTSSHLLVGLARIFQRKVNYLIADSEDTFHRLNSTLKPGQVDLADADSGPAAGINMLAPYGGADMDMPELANVDVLE